MNTKCSILKMIVPQTDNDDQMQTRARKSAVAFVVTIRPRLNLLQLRPSLFMQTRFATLYAFITVTIA